MPKTCALRCMIARLLAFCMLISLSAGGILTGNLAPPMSLGGQASLSEQTGQSETANARVGPVHRIGSANFTAAHSYRHGAMKLPPGTPSFLATAIPNASSRAMHMARRLRRAIQRFSKQCAGWAMTWKSFFMNVAYTIRMSTTGAIAPACINGNGCHGMSSFHPRFYEVQLPPNSFGHLATSATMCSETSRPSFYARDQQSSIFLLNMMRTTHGHTSTSPMKKRSNGKDGVYMNSTSARQTERISARPYARLAPATIAA